MTCRRTASPTNHRYYALSFSFIFSPCSKDKKMDSECTTVSKKCLSYFHICILVQSTEYRAACTVLYHTVHTYIHIGNRLFYAIHGSLWFPGSFGTSLIFFIFSPLPVPEKSMEYRVMVSQD